MYKTKSLATFQLPGSYVIQFLCPLLVAIATLDNPTKRKICRTAPIINHDYCGEEAGVAIADKG